MKSQKPKQSGFQPEKDLDAVSASIHDEDNEAIEDDGAEEFFAFQSGSKKKKTKESARPRAESAAYSLQDQKMMLDEPNQGYVHDFQIDDLFGKIFGIERVHIMKKTDKLQEIIEKISIVPENKLVFIEENPSENGSFSI